MHISKPAWKYEINVTTVVALVGLIATAGGWFWSDGQYRQEIRGWIASHENMHKERQATVASDTARADQRLTFLEAEARKYENVIYRVTVLEQGSVSLGRSVDELKAAVNGQAADIRVMLEIMRRLDPGGGPAINR